MILNALSQPGLAPSAALAFRDLCGECAEMLVPVAVQLIPACQVSSARMSVYFNKHPPPPHAGISLSLFKIELHLPPSCLLGAKIQKY